MEKYLLSSPKDYKIINQTGYKQYVFPLEFEHNAIWDGNVTKDGVPVALHDDNLRRMTNADTVIYIHEITWAQAKKYSLEGRNFQQICFACGK